METLLHLSAAEIVRRIRQRDLKPSQVLEAHIQRIEAVNPKINALITPNFEQARTEAQAADARLESGATDALPALFGLPITVKDCWAVNGLRFTGGSYYMRDNIANFDAEAVRRLKAAGAIIMGKSNLPDMCWSGETVNPIFGQTNNPRNLAYTAGGSSGGEGALVAAGASPLGLGSDIAGSVRIPAAENGCVSLKPTAGRIPSHDHVPFVSEPIGSWNTAGPLARRIEDLALALEVLSETPVQDYRQINLKNRRCVVTIHNGLIPVRSSVVETVTMAADSLKNAGMAVEHDDKVPLAQTSSLYAALMSKHGNIDFKKALGGGKPYHLWQEIRANMQGKGRISPRVLWHTTYIDIMAPIAHLLGENSFEQLEQYKQQFAEKIGAGGVMLCPLLITEPQKHGWTWTLATQPPYSFLFNALGFPAVIVPIRYNTKGLPLVVQVVACPNEDEVVLAVAQELENIYGGWKIAEVR
jgi:fatty acid amide hydrolase 2